MSGREPKSMTRVEHGALRCGCRRAFSLIELVVVISVTLIMTAILMPALQGLREHTERVISASNMRQLGMGMMMYSTDRDRRLPYSAFVHLPEPGLMQEMMAVHIGHGNVDRFMLGPYSLQIDDSGFDGLGLLYAYKYVDVPNIFYCPAHRGDHHFERYRNEWETLDDIIYGNYHYRGDVDPFDRMRAMNFDRDAYRVFVVDGMRTRRDFNHRNGFNSLMGDGSVFWRFDDRQVLYRMLPISPMDGESGQAVYKRVWEIIDD